MVHFEKYKTTGESYVFWHYIPSLSIKNIYSVVLDQYVSKGMELTITPDLKILLILVGSESLS